MLLVDRQHPAELLQAIPVKDRGQITQLVSRGDVQSFPDHPFLQFAVAQHDEGVKLLPSHSGAQGEAQTD